MIYYYKAKNSRKTLGSYNLKEVTECTTAPSDNAFYLVRRMNLNEDTDCFFVEYCE